MFLIIYTIKKYYWREDCLSVVGTSALISLSQERPGWCREEDGPDPAEDPGGAQGTLQNKGQGFSRNCSILRAYLGTLLGIVLVKEQFIAEVYGYKRVEATSW